MNVSNSIWIHGRHVLPIQSLLVGIFSRLFKCYFHCYVLLIAFFYLHALIYIMIWILSYLTAAIWSCQINRQLLSIYLASLFICYWSYHSGIFKVEVTGVSWVYCLCRLTYSGCSWLLRCDPVSKLTPGLDWHWRLPN